MRRFALVGNQNIFRHDGIHGDVAVVGDEKAGLLAYIFKTAIGEVGHAVTDDIEAGTYHNRGLELVHVCQIQNLLLEFLWRVFWKQFGCQRQIILALYQLLYGCFKFLALIGIVTAEIFHNDLQRYDFLLD